MKRNLTVQLDEETIKKAKIVAAKRSTSVSGLLVAEIERLVADDEAFDRGRAFALTRLARPRRLGGGALPERDSLHER